MAQMRVKDQDLVIDQIKSEVSSQGLEALKNRKNTQEILCILDANIDEIKTLQAQKDELGKTIKKIKTSMNERVDKFNKQFSTEDGSQSWSNHLYFRGIDLNSASYGEGIPEYKIEWNMSRKDSKALETKLRLQTMGTDFDVYKLSDDLISEFSS